MLLPAFINAILLSLHLANAFSPSPLASSTNAVAICRSSSCLFYNHDKEEEGVSATNKLSWTLKQDWALMDQLPKFTVGSPDSDHRSIVNIRTFWAQMVACTPILSNKTPHELLKRCQELKEEEAESNNSMGSSTSRSLIFGPSPPLLQNWSIDDRTSNNNMAVGQTQDGRTIWLQYHMIGRLEGDPFSDISSSSVLCLVPGGYLEAIGGRIYELGEPRHTRSSTRSSSTTATQTTESHDKEKPLDWWIPPATATMSALLASTVLSACIGYCAGLSIISDGSSVSPPSSSSSSSSSSPQTLEEQRARTEYRIYKEQRLLHTLSERLEQDQQRLIELRQPTKLIKLE